MKCSSTSSATTSTAAPAAPWPSCTRSSSSSTTIPTVQDEFVEVANNPEDPSAGTRQVPFSREIYIEQDDFREVPPPKYYRLSPGKEVRLRNAYFVTAQSVVKDAAGNIVEVHCTYDPASRGGNSPDGRKVKSTMHWVSAAHAISAEIRLYDKLFTKADPYDFEEGQDVLDNLNPNSLEILTGAKLEPSLANAKLERPLPVRARRLLLPRSRLDPGQTGLQPHPAAQRLLGQDREEGRSVNRSRPCRFPKDQLKNGILKETGKILIFILRGKLCYRAVT